MKSLSILITVLTLSLSACGFHMRGSSVDSLGASSIYIQAGNAVEIAAQLRSRLVLDEVTIADAPSKADLVITLNSEQFDRRVLSVDANTGKVREFELGYEVTLSATHQGREILATQKLELLRDFTFDETAVLGTFQEEAVLRRELAEDAADMALRRIQAVNSSR
jgi:LPS-assembly lipoprotein